MFKNFRAWVAGRDTWNGVGQNIIANLIVAGIVLIPTSVVMAWDYMTGQSGPWILALGIFTSASVLWLRQQILAIMAKHAASQMPRPAVEDAAALAAKKKADRDNRRKQIDLAVVLEEKEALKSQLASAPAVFEPTTAIAWYEGTRGLVRKLRHVTNITEMMNKHQSADQQRESYARAMAEVRAMLVRLAEEEAQLRH
jgi:hypothetical protein